MTVIKKEKELRLENVLSLRKKMIQAEVHMEIMRIGKLLEEKGAKKNGPIITATFSIENINGQPLLDMEILVPLDKKIDVSSEYKLKDIFHLVNAIYARHEGNPALLQNTYNEMMTYIQQNGLQQITAGYNLNIRDLVPGQNMNEMIVDVYIGVNPSVL